MPELPEVNTVVEQLKNYSILDRQITAVNIYWPKTLTGYCENEFAEKIKGQKIINVFRRAKYICIELTTGTLLIHLKMTGKLLAQSINNYEMPHKHERASLILDDELVLSFEDQRKFGKWFYVLDTAEKFSQLGPEPFSDEFTAEYLQTKLRNIKQKIKSFLLNQKYIAGIGNIYADESLWRAKILPSRIGQTLTSQEIIDLHQSIKDSLQSGIDNGGTSLGDKGSNYRSVKGDHGSNQHKLQVFQRTGLPCYRCGVLIQKIFLAQRGTHFCQGCQI